jgi:prepilin peptidase CpaA
LCGFLGGLLLQASVTPGAGLFSNPFGAIGVQQGAIGIVLGLLMLLPMYALGAMGAGDVKLLAMIGGFLGPVDIIGAGLTSMLVGGLLSLAVAMANGALKRVMSNVKHIVIGSVLRTVSGGSPQMSVTANRTGKLPYAVAIASGTTIYLVLTRYANLSLLN